MTEKLREQPIPKRAGFDATMAGKRAECDGGQPIAGGHTASREEYTGVLTGDYVDHGDPPWRWYRLTQLSRKPDGYPWDEVWCDHDSLYFIEQSS